eukprot:TRINITY_DN9567_c0_g2_i1.p1 TRINITY_DN9567_c0_g2~~TRINITY_DN9567_c0_g2_i1.p1  ORF type:complete len:125 (+),score=17.47 TRINITY_DN9567_c0_g2_i1:267-641(+)
MTEIPIFDKRTLSPPLYQPISKKGLTLESMTNDFSEFASIWSEPLGKPIPLYIEHRPSPFSNIHFPFHSVLSFHWFGYQSESVFSFQDQITINRPGGKGGGSTETRRPRGKIITFISVSNGDYH